MILFKDKTDDGLPLINGQIFHVNKPKLATKNFIVVFDSHEEYELKMMELQNKTAHLDLEREKILNEVFNNV